MLLVPLRQVIETDRSWSFDACHRHHPPHRSTHTQTNYFALSLALFTCLANLAYYSCHQPAFDSNPFGIYSASLQSVPKLDCVHKDSINFSTIHSFGQSSRFIASLELPLFLNRSRCERPVYWPKYFKRHCSLFTVDCFASFVWSCVSSLFVDV